MTFVHILGEGEEEGPEEEVVQAAYDLVKSMVNFSRVFPKSCQN